MVLAHSNEETKKPTTAPNATWVEEVRIVYCMTRWSFRRFSRVYLNLP